MKRRTFIKTGILGAFATGITPGSLLKGRDCDTTSLDILGPYWAEDHPYRTVLANLEEPGTRVFISGTVKAVSFSRAARSIKLWAATSIPGAMAPPIKVPK